MTNLDIKVTGLEVRAVNAPLEIPIQTAVGTVASAPLVLIDINTNAGVTGHAWIFSYTPVCLIPLREMVQSLRSFIEGNDLNPVAISFAIEKAFLLVGHTGLLRMATAGIDMALWDAFAKASNSPLYKILGGNHRPIKAYDSHSMDGAVLAVERAKRSLKEGFKALKTKIGYDTVEEDIAVIRAIKSATDNKIAVMVDYNQSLDVPEAIKRSQLLENEGIVWIEEPTKQYDYFGHAKISSSTHLPIQMGENWLGIFEMNNCLQANSCDLAMADIMKIGGVTGWLKAATLAESKGIPLSSHLFQEFSAHVLTVTPTADWLERMDIASSILDSSLRFIEGQAILSDEPGAGFVWKDSEISKYVI
ncbi:enolase C-terminal domain-like protein [Pantoea sp. App145]|uniref:enolase C-terminal domain-like protein n=1 Tax=Pantoea sp. App145 TaxID=3071567 RepID=UPI003A7F65DC